MPFNTDDFVAALPATVNEFMEGDIDAILDSLPNEEILTGLERIAHNPRGAAPAPLAIGILMGVQLACVAAQRADLEAMRREVDALGDNDLPF